ncbi:O-antigen ligase family protein [Chloroflexus sp.]|uniref:O-antigen ligase family protein n=1 Tax=Chloroflexus sp. TaxID=1904827 RepID=UPI0026137DEA|nr:O-antigen ligase family protein [uncultured Chloroflexus sp.]
MLDLLVPRYPDAATVARRNERRWWLLFLAVCALTGAVMLLLRRQMAPESVLSFLIFGGVLVATAIQPRFGLYAILGLTLFGDRSLHPWYPFTKNLSSPESIMYMSDSFSFSPQELTIVWTLVVWFVRVAAERRLSRIHFGPLFWPATIFLLFNAIGLAYGLANGGNRVIALWEVRAIFYLPLMLLLAGNLIETRSQLNTLFWVATVALFAKGVAGVWYVHDVLKWDLAGVERIAEHAMSIHFNFFFVLLIAAWLYRDSAARRFSLILMAPFVLFSLIANFRRAGFLTLGIAIGLIVLLLYLENRRLFFLIAPTSAAAFVAYLVVFWNNQGPLGILARAVRSVIGQPSARDAASNIYRDLENINIMFTIRSAPLTGIGFGNKFYMVVPMPDISFFEWWEYITHNSIMWVWMKIGVIGFFAFILLLALTMLYGARMVRLMPHGQLRVFALTATLYIFTHFVYAYVDMSWEGGSMVFVGTMMGVINALPQIAAGEEPLVYRWRVFQAQRDNQPSG